MTTSDLTAMDRSGILITPQSGMIDRRRQSIRVADGSFDRSGSADDNDDKRFQFFPVSASMERSIGPDPRIKLLPLLRQSNQT
mmetsp:Transcript_10037/g.22817  ORF Transcript_10037/g.22817 Transcript_10037/m.22817 type:complete len:83 (+) Transcript_10037:82-330(+)